MSIFVLILLVLHLLFFVYEDFRYRAISALPLLTLFAASIYYSATFIGIRNILINDCLIFLFLLFQYSFLKLYFVLKKPHDSGIINEKLGIGDVLYFTAIIPLFSPLQFIYIYLIGLVLVLCFYVAFKRLFSSTVPLAGLFSIYLIVILLAGHMANHALCIDALYDFN